jgi:Domain of unknown function (DUF4105)
VIFGQVILTAVGILHAFAAYFYFSKERHAVPWAAGWVALTALALWQLPIYPVATAISFCGAIAAWSWWWESIPALSARNWVPEDARQATATLVGDHLSVHDVRNFIWKGRHDFVPRWEERSYDLANLSAVDLFVSTWGDPRVAHLILSFAFTDNVALAFSIETRREATERWSILAGFMKSYELCIIAADERDVIRVRSNIRHERVWRYRIRTTPGMRRRMLVRYIDLLNDVAARPRFYNSLYRNCTTEIVHILRAAGRPVPLDWRLVVSGYVPQYLYQHRLIPTDQPFDKIQAEADIGALAQAADADLAFSAAIRGERR